MEFLSLASAAVDRTMLAAGAFDQDASHGRCCRREEVAPTAKARAGVFPNQAQIRFVDKSRGLERLPRLLVSQFLSGKLAQFIIDQRQKLAGRLLIALVNFGKEKGKIRHRSLPGAGVGDAAPGKSKSKIKIRMRI